MDLTDAIKEAYECAPADITYFDTLELNHDSFTTPIRVVRSFRNITTDDGEFTAVMFDFSLPETEGGVRGEMVVTINGIPMEARTAIRQAASSTSIVTVRYRQYILSTSDPEYPNPTTWAADAELPVDLNVSMVRETQLGLEASVMFPDLVGAYFPRRIMTSTAFPGLLQ